MTNKFHPGRFEVDIEGKKVVLKPTVEAYEKLCTRYMGLSMLSNLCQTMNINALADVIWAGSDADEDELPRIKKAIFDGHAHNYVLPTVKFVTSLIYGGQEPDEQEENKDTDPKEE